MPTDPKSMSGTINMFLVAKTAEGGDTIINVYDPQVLFRQATRNGWTVDKWHNKANSYRCPHGIKPGVGYFLISRKQAKAITDLHRLDLEIHCGDEKMKIFDLAIESMTALYADHLTEPSDNCLCLCTVRDERCYWKNDSAYGSYVSSYRNLYEPSSYFMGSVSLHSPRIPARWEEIIGHLWPVRTDTGAGRIFPGLPGNNEFNEFPANLHQPPRSDQNLELFLRSILCTISFIPWEEDQSKRLEVHRVGADQKLPSPISKNVSDALEELHQFLVSSDAEIPGVANLPGTFQMVFRQQGPINQQAGVNAQYTYGTIPFQITSDRRGVGTGSVFDFIVRNTMNDSYGDYLDGGDYDVDGNYDGAITRRKNKLAEHLTEQYENLGHYHCLLSGIHKICPGGQIAEVVWGDYGAGPFTEVKGYKELFYVRPEEVITRELHPPVAYTYIGPAEQDSMPNANEYSKIIEIGWAQPFAQSPIGQNFNGIDGIDALSGSGVGARYPNNNNVERWKVFNPGFPIKQYDMVLFQYVGTIIEADFYEDGGTTRTTAKACYLVTAVLKGEVVEIVTDIRYNPYDLEVQKLVSTGPALTTPSSWEKIDGGDVNPGCST